MAKFIIEGTMLETLRLILPTMIPLTVERELVMCQDCVHCITIPQFPDHPYCEARLFGKTVQPDFFCADGERRTE